MMGFPPPARNDKSSSPDCAHGAPRGPASISKGARPHLVSTGSAISVWLLPPAGDARARSETRREEEG